MAGWRGYTSSPDFHINEDGVGYLVQTPIQKIQEMVIQDCIQCFLKKQRIMEKHGQMMEGIKIRVITFIPDEVMMELTDSLWTMYSENADDSAYATKLWYPWNHV